MKSPAWDLLETPPYSLGQEEKTRALLPRLQSLTAHHHQHCEIYRNVVDRVFGGVGRIAAGRIEEIPFLPISLFKTHELKSIPDSEVVKVLTSSGTTGQQVSRIYVDAETTRVQSAVLIKVAQHYLGKARLPMVVIDHPGVISDRRSFSARGAGILGMAQFGVKPFYALREDMSLDTQGLVDYLASIAGKPMFVFGFTYMVWEYFVRALEVRGLTVDLSQGMLIHSGGWKKLADAEVSPETFRARLQALTRVRSVVNFYGMVEQVGGVYFENPIHYLHAPIFSEVIIRDPVTLRPVPDGQVGLIQVLSCLPTSYPGHSLLTEDLGVIRGSDVPDLPMKGRCFEVLGRVPKSELRGCSDTFQPVRAS